MTSSSNGPGRDVGRFATGPVRLLVDAQRLVREPYARQPVRGRLDDHEGVAVEHGTGRLAQPGGQRRDGPRDRVVATDRAVVGVAHRDAPVGERGDAEGVLEHRVLGRTVDQAEVEQPASDRRADRAVRQQPQRRGLGVDEPESLPVGGEPHGQTRGLGEPRLGRRSVAQSLVGGAGEHGHLTRDRVVGPELVDASHRDDDARQLSRPDHVPRAREPLGGVAVHPLLSRARKRSHLAGGERDPAQRVVDGVGDDHVIADLGGNGRPAAGTARWAR